MRLDREKRSTSVWSESRPVTFTLTFAGVGERLRLLETCGGRRATGRLGV